MDDTDSWSVSAALPVEPRPSPSMPTPTSKSGVRVSDVARALEGIRSRTKTESFVFVAWLVFGMILIVVVVVLTSLYFLINKKSGGGPELPVLPYARSFEDLMRRAGGSCGTGTPASFVYGANMYWYCKCTASAPTTPNSYFPGGGQKGCDSRPVPCPHDRIPEECSKPLDCVNRPTFSCVEASKVCSGKACLAGTVCSGQSKITIGNDDVFLCDRCAIAAKQCDGAGGMWTLGCDPASRTCECKSPGVTWIRVDPETCSPSVNYGDAFMFLVPYSAAAVLFFAYIALKKWKVRHSKAK